MTLDNVLTIRRIKAAKTVMALDTHGNQYFSLKCAQRSGVKLICEIFGQICFGQVKLIAISYRLQRPLIWISSSFARIV